MRHKLHVHGHFRGREGCIKIGLSSLEVSNLNRRKEWPMSWLYHPPSFSCCLFRFWLTWALILTKKVVCSWHQGGGCTASTSMWWRPTIDKLFRYAHSTLRLIAVVPVDHSRWFPSLRLAWWWTAGQWFRHSPGTRTWPEKPPPMPAWWLWRRATRPTSDWREATWWEAGSTPHSQASWFSPCEKDRGLKRRKVRMIERKKGTRWWEKRKASICNLI